MKPKILLLALIISIFFSCSKQAENDKSDGSVNENDENPYYVYPLVAARVFDVNETYHEPIGDDIHF